jgi:hypothetical protein
MAHNHRMQGIADPYINQRNAMIAREQDTRSRMQMPHASEGYAGLEGHSEMQNFLGSDGMSDSDTTTDYELGAFDVPVNPAVRAFQESGHGVQVFEGYKGQ